MGGGRGFQEVSVTRLGVQTGVQRFGLSSQDQNPVLVDDDSEDDEDVDLPDTHPRVLEGMMNLTALSRFHNLYFAVYVNSIYVYKPQGPNQILSQTPALTIEPPQSTAAIYSYSAVERFCSHVINHIVVGNLGNKEILLCSFDDGDVVAYYTDAIEDAYNFPAADQAIPIQPFFAENVGNSAWGLAIHQQSRLVAVGSNSHEVQLFAFALTSPEPQERIPQSQRPLYAGTTRYPEVNQRRVPRTNDGHIVRDYGFRLVFRMPPVGHNIPSISFSDDVHGDAETIVAKDVKGAVWLFRIWEKRWKRLPTVVEPTSLHVSSIGWGVMVLPRNFFKPTYTQSETYGHSGSAIACSDFKTDISKSIRHVRESSLWHEGLELSGYEDSYYLENYPPPAWSQSFAEEPEMDLDVDVEDTVSEADLASEPFREGPFSESFLMDEGSTAIPSTTIPAVISASPTAPTPPSENLPLSWEFDPASFGSTTPVLTANRTISSFITSDALVLHTNRHSITLIPSSDSCRPTYCNNVVRQEIHHGAWFPRPLRDYDRLNMILTIPELSLVLVASQVGRVALVTITRSADRNRQLTGTVAMRVDLILPFSHEETVEKIRPNFGLLGMAVGPLQRGRERAEARRSLVMGTEGHAQRRTVGPRRWRLLLHYLNHDILAYEISRDEETEELKVF